MLVISEAIYFMTNLIEKLTLTRCIVIKSQHQLAQNPKNHAFPREISHMTLVAGFGTRLASCHSSILPRITVAGFAHAMTKGALPYDRSRFPFRKIH